MRGKKVSLCENLHPILIKSDDCKPGSTQGPVKLSRPRHQKHVSEVYKMGLPLEPVGTAPRIGLDAASFLDSKINILASPSSNCDNPAVGVRYGTLTRHSQLEKAQRFKSHSVQKENVRQVIKNCKGLFQSIDDSNRLANQN